MARVPVRRLLFRQQPVLSALRAALRAVDRGGGVWLLAGKSAHGRAGTGHPVAVAILNLLGAELGKWASDMGGVATILMGVLLMAAGWFAWRHGGPVTPLHNFVRRMDWEKLNFWSQIALASPAWNWGPSWRERSAIRRAPFPTPPGFPAWRSAPFTWAEPWR